MLNCNDCGIRYGDEFGCPDLVIPKDAWLAISPTGHAGGILCPNCICKRLHAAGIKCVGAFMSGPVISISPYAMEAIARAERGERNGIL